MNVLLLTPELFSAEGGLSRILRLYLKGFCELASSDEQVRLVTLIDPTIDSADLRAYANERLIDWAACGRSKIGFLKAALRSARKSDLIVCGHIGQLPIAWFCRLRYPRLRYVLVAHGLEVWRRFSWLEKRALNSAEKFWCVSEFTRGEILKYSRLPSNRAVVLANGLDPFLHEDKSVPAQANHAQVIVTISRLTWSDRYKGVDHLIQALPAIRERFPQVRLRIIGRGDDLPRLQKLAVDLPEAVQFLGYVSDATIKKEIAACSVFALPSEREGFGLVYLEAMTQGKPCVAANAGGAPEVITAATGLLIPFGNVTALASACVEALARKWDPASIRARAEEFSYPNFRHRLKTLLEG